MYMICDKMCLLSVVLHPPSLYIHSLVIILISNDAAVHFLFKLSLPTHILKYFSDAEKKYLNPIDQMLCWCCDMRQMTFRAVLKVGKIFSKENPCNWSYQDANDRCVSVPTYKIYLLLNWITCPLIFLLFNFVTKNWEFYRICGVNKTFFSTSVQILFSNKSVKIVSHWNQELQTALNKLMLDKRPIQNYAWEKRGDSIVLQINKVEFWG